MSAGAREGVEGGGEQVGPGASGAPGGEAGGEALSGLGGAHGVPQFLRIRAVHEDAGVGRLELIGDGVAAARGHGDGWSLASRSEAGHESRRDTDICSGEREHPRTAGISRAAQRRKRRTRTSLNWIMIGWSMTMTRSM